MMTMILGFTAGTSAARAVNSVAQSYRVRAFRRRANFMMGDFMGGDSPCGHPVSGRLLFV
jgi:hypothetical protein